MNKIQSFKLLYDISEAAKMFNMNRTKFVSQYLKSGRISTYTDPSGKIHIPHDQLADEINSNLKFYNPKPFGGETL